MGVGLGLGLGLALGLGLGSGWSVQTCKIEIDHRHPSVKKFDVYVPVLHLGRSSAWLSYRGTYHPTRTNPCRTSRRGTRCPVQQVHCTPFQASRHSPLTAMLVVEGVVIGFTAFMAGGRTQMAKYGSGVNCSQPC